MQIKRVLVLVDRFYYTYVTGCSSAFSHLVKCHTGKCRISTSEARGEYHHTSKHNLAFKPSQHWHAQIEGLVIVRVPSPVMPNINIVVIVSMLLSPNYEAYFAPTNSLPFRAMQLLATPPRPERFIRRDPLVICDRRASSPSLSARYWCSATPQCLHNPQPGVRRNRFRHLEK